MHGVGGGSATTESLSEATRGAGDEDVDALGMAWEDVNADVDGGGADALLEDSARRIADHFRVSAPLEVLYDAPQSRVTACTRVADGAGGFVVKLTKAHVPSMDEVTPKGCA
jgi:hypothetical protein